MTDRENEFDLSSFLNRVMQGERETFELEKHGKVTLILMTT